MADIEALRREKIGLRAWLQGRKFHMAERAWSFAETFHSGTRKDGVTPEFAHQIGIANLIRNFESVLIHPEETIATVFLHDVMEDYGVLKEDLANRFGDQVARSTFSVTKVYRGIKRNIEEVFDECAQDPIGSVVKGGDRSNNQGSMVGVFTLAKQQDYIEESETWILPMMKRARKLFPEQQPVYQTLQYILRREIDLVRSIHLALDPEQAHLVARQETSPSL